MHTAVKAPFLTFVRNPAEPSLQTVETNNNHLQKEALYAVAATYDEVLLGYQTFIDASIEDYQQAYRHYARQGGQCSFFDHCWTSLLNDAVAEAGNLLHENACDFQHSIKLLQDLKRISEGYLLVLDKALA